MRLVYLTFKGFPAKTADIIYTRELSHGFTQVLGDGFTLAVVRNNSDELSKIPHINLGFRKKNFRTLYYFFWIPFFAAFKIRWGRDVVFFSNDQFLLASLLIWKKIFLFSYLVCADWHMLCGDWKDKFIARNADRHITTTEHLRQQIIKIFNTKSANIKAIYGGVADYYFNEEISKSELRKMFHLPENKILVGYVGFFKTLGMEKGINTMIESLRYFKKDQNIMMVFVGGKEEEIEFYKKYAVEKNVLDKCIFVGRMHSTKSCLYLRALDILVIPYPDNPHFRDYGFPMKTYEYMASGTPILYSKLMIIDEVLNNFGRSFRPDDPESFAKEVESMLLHAEETQKRANLAKEKAHMLTWRLKAEEIVRYIT